MRNLGLIALVLLLAPSFIRAQAIDLYEEKLPIGAHQKRPSAVKFVGDELDSFDGGVVYSADPDSLPPGAGKIDILQNCLGSLVQKLQLNQDNPEAKHLDLVFYSPSDPLQTQKAQKWTGVAVPFIEGWEYNPYKEEDSLQEFARIIRLRCLPTRFRIISEDGSYYTEYREGDAAWDNLK